MQTDTQAALIMREAIKSCAALYPRGTRIKIRFGDRGLNRLCIIKHCLGAEYLVKIETSGEIRRFHPELHRHRMIDPQRQLSFS